MNDVLIDAENFTEQARAFLDAHARPLPPSEIRWGEGSDAIGAREDMTDAEEHEMLTRARQWRSVEFDHGFGWLTGPRAYGGQELPVEFERRYRELRTAYDVGSHRPFVIGLGMVAPTILAHGTPEVKEAYLRRLFRGDLVGCQLFSEPGAGSDLAAVATRAERDGDAWVITGQKVWTSGAQYSDLGEILCRTDPSLPKHAGLTAFVVDMRAPGVEIRPLVTMTGHAPFNEVFFDEVRIPDSHRLGDVNGGWRVAITTLMGERALGATPGVFGIEHGMTMLLELAKQTGAVDDPVLRQSLMRAYVGVKTVELNGLRTDAARRSGREPGPEASIFKLSNTEVARVIAGAASEILGASLVADTGEWGTYSWAQFVLGLPGMRIAAGTDEVMRNILGERVLGLPKDPVG
jgi:alkylation response protein AidB-like acyl-CoA dehydrogenase